MEFVSFLNSIQTIVNHALIQKVFSKILSTIPSIKLLCLVSPDPVENCTVIKKSSESFHLRCIPGFDGGLNQTFAVQVQQLYILVYRYSSYIF